MTAAVDSKKTKLGRSVRSSDLQGKKFGRLTVCGVVWSEKKRCNVWLCNCDCGATVTATSYELKKGFKQSCGCLQKEIASKKIVENRKKLGIVNHNLSHTRIYRSWHHMKSRCYNKRDASYERYGARGITVCDEWKDNFKAFYDWSYFHGYNDTLTLDRIDNSLGYSPSNCRWITNKQQQRNKRNNVFIVYRGIKKVLKDWADSMGVKSSILHERIKKFGVEIAFAMSVKNGIRKEDDNE